MSDQERPYSQSYNISSYPVSQNPASSEYRSGTSTSFPTQNPQAPTQQPQMLAYTYQHGRDPAYPLQMTNVMATPTSMLPPMRNSPMIGNVPIPQYMAPSVPSPMHMCTAPQGNYYTQAPALPQTISVMGIQQPRFYAPIPPPAPQTRHGITRRRTEIKRRTKTGCLTCRGRRIKVSLTVLRLINR
jgi:white-opaque regulator 2